MVEEFYFSLKSERQTGKLANSSDLVRVRATRPNRALIGRAVNSHVLDATNQSELDASQSHWLLHRPKAQLT